MKELESNHINLIDAKEWLESTIDLTRYKDYVPLTQALIEKLNDIPNISQVNIYEVCGVEDNKSTNDLMLKDVLNLLSAPVPFYERINQYDADLKESERSAAGEVQQTVFPIQSSGKIQRILVIDCLSFDKDHWYHIISTLNVYNNLLSIIDEKDRDRLTGLLNRYTFDNNLTNIINHSKQEFKQSRGGSGKNSWIAILDIDHFKQVNDNYGHIIGDEVLLLFSRLLLSTFRYSDIVFRFGGEEFIVILTGCDQKGAEIAFNRFRTTIESYSFPQVGRVTVSTGYVMLDTSYFPNVLLDQADRALYIAKETGRNKVVSYKNMALIDKKANEAGTIELF